MHDIDRTQLETQWETEPAGEFEYEDYESDMSTETDGEFYEDGFEDTSGEFEADGPIGEADEIELAAELQEISDEQELDQFIGKLFNRVRRSIGRALPPGIRSSLGGMLKGIAKRYLPTIGSALGNMVVPGLGGMVGGQLASRAGQAFGLELEGLSPEDQEFEVARRYVRTATEAAQRAASAATTAQPQFAAQRALVAAAQRHAPGLVSRAYSAAGMPAPRMIGGRRARSGRWVRRGRQIILFI